MVDWSFFRNKRRLDVTQWLVKLNLLTYTDFSKALLALGVKPPSEDIYKALVKEIEQSANIPPVVNEKSVAEVAKPTPEKKPARKRPKRSQKSSVPAEGADE
jgi:hypothetical protein